MYRLIIISGCAVFCLQSVQSFAEEIDQIIVTGTHSASATEAIANTVTVLDRDAIARLGKTSFADVLRSISGVSVRQSGGAGGVNELHIRGGESNFTLVMIDGVKVNDTTNTRGGGFNFNAVNLESVERVEIIRGTQSAVYGGDALAGVINIITRRAEKNTIAQNAVLDVGEHNALRIGYGLRAANDVLSAKLNVSSVDRGDEIMGSSYENKQVVAGLEWQASDKTTIAWQGRYLDDERYSYTQQSGGDVYALDEALELNSSQELSQNISWQQTLHSKWQSRVDVNVFNRDSVMVSPGIIPYTAVPPNEAVTDYTNTEIKWVNTLGTPNALWLNVGLVHQSEDGQSVGSLFGLLDTSFALKRKNTAGFLELNYHNKDKLSTHISVRYDDPEGLSPETSFSVGARVPITTRLSASANWGKGFKLPSFFALGHPLVGNASLKPERAKNSELRLQYQDEAWGNASVAVFESHYRDLIDFDADLFINVNRARVDIRGVEVDWVYQGFENMQIKLFASFMNIDTHATEVVLSGRPKQQYGVNWDWQFSEDKSIHLDYRHVGKQFDTSLYTGASVRETLSHYDLFDANFTWGISELVSLQFIVNNALNKKYYEAIGFSSPGRNFHVKVNFDF